MIGTSKQYVPGPSFGNIEVVREGIATPVTSSYGYTGSNIDPGLAGPDAPTAVGTTTLTYDEFGRVVTKGSGETFGYDLAGRLITVSRSAGPSETIEYDPFGLPVRRTVNGQVIWYLGRQATVTGIGGALKADVHVEVNGQRVASVRVGATPRTLFLHRDRLTSVVATTLAGRVAGASYRYTAHGAVEAASGDTGDSASELGYAGALRLSGGLLWMGARVYDPALKIFLQPDPLAPHTYAYADGDPINRWDPTGLKPGPVIIHFTEPTEIWGNPPPPPTVTQSPMLTPPPPPPPLPPVNTSIPPSYGPHLAPGDTSGANRGSGSEAGGGGGGGSPGSPRFYVDLYLSMPAQYHARVANSGSPEYLINYGFRYALMFSELAERTGSPDVRLAVRRIMRQLQVSLLLEMGRDNRLRVDPVALGKAAFRSHAAAYAAGGFGELAVGEQFEILDVVGVSDLDDFGAWTGATAVAGGLSLVHWPKPGLVPYP